MYVRVYIILYIIIIYMYIIMYKHVVLNRLISFETRRAASVSIIIRTCIKYSRLLHV